MDRNSALKTLGLASSASADEIKRAYKLKALETHPDKGGHGFQKVAEAYKCLTEADDVYEEMYEEFCDMCFAAGIPAPTPDVARALFDAGDLGTLFDGEAVFEGDDLGTVFDGEADVARALFEGEEEEEIPLPKVGSRVVVNGSAGCVKYVGPVHYSSKQFVGVALDDPHGKNDGVVKGRRYFTCAPQHGVMVLL